MKKSVTSPRRRMLKHSLAAGMLLAFAGTGYAQQAAYPNKTVTIIVPYPAGGTTDVFARLTSNKLSKKWGVPVIVENRGGVGGLLGSSFVAKAPADGYTLLQTITGLVQAPALYPNPLINPVKDFAPIAMLGTNAVGFAVSASSPIKTLDDYIRMARAEPNKHFYASWGVGSTGHLSIEVFKSVANLKVNHVPYKGEAPSLTDMLGGQIEAGIFSVRALTQYEAAGKIRVLAITGTDRVPSLPNTPTFKEAGIPGLESLGWYGVLAPAGTPRAIVNKLSDDYLEVLKDPEVQAKMKEMGIDRHTAGAEDYTKIVKNDFEMWSSVVRKFNIKYD